MYGSSCRTTVPLESSVCITADSVHTKQKMTVLHEDVKIDVGSWQHGGLSRLFVGTKELFVWKCVLFPVSHSCILSECNELSSVLHLIAVKRPFLTCNVAGVDIISGLRALRTSLSNKKRAARSPQETPRDDIVIV